ncbi:MAG: hypothetical protein JWO70_4179 [Betaproteobacteria bacterium]|jgi:hypothetical protein|nr:hypothetical protein [Betaproteobacteria bacterium]
MKRLLPSLPVVLLFFCAALVASPASAAAAKTAPPTVIESFVVDPANELTPGTELSLTVQGTPKGKATVRINGLPRTVTLKEVDAGAYEGSYTVRRTDKIAPNAAVRATLVARGRSAVATVNLKAAPPVAAAPATPTPAAPGQTAAKIERFNVAPVDKLDPGVDLKFTLIGTPGARAAVNIQGVNRDVAMTEVKSGQYEASYTVRRLDHFPPSGNIVARLEAGGQTARTRLNQALLVAAKAPTLKNVSPRDNEVVAPGQTTISGTFDDSGGVAVEPKSVRILLDGRDVTQNSSITPQFFTYRVAPPPGTHQVQVNAQDVNGNPIRQSWSFSVGSQAAAGVPIEITSHQNNAQIAGGATEVRGRTAANAQVDVKVTQTASVAGLFGVNQELLSQTVRADPNGNFTFRFQPQINVPGARYEVALKSRTDQATSRDIQLVLFQQK